MKLLVFSDLHGNFDVLSRLKAISEQADAVLCAGDISTMEHNLPALVDELGSFGKPVLIIHGNHEDEESLKTLAKRHGNIVFMHRGAHHIGDYVFLGYGGGGFSREEPDLSRVAKNFFRNEVTGKKRIVFITHAPPYNTKLDLIGREHRGNVDSRKLIDDIKPHLVVCGHFHENAGVTDKIGRTLIVNPGMEGVMVEI